MTNNEGKPMIQLEPAVKVGDVLSQSTRWGRVQRVLALAPAGYYSGVVENGRTDHGTVKFNRWPTTKRAN